MITFYDDWYDTPHEGMMGSASVLTVEEEEYDAASALHDVVREVTNYSPPERQKRRIGFI